LAYEFYYVFTDTSVLVKIVYSITLSYIRRIKLPEILGILESNRLVIFTDRAVINELINRALPNLLSRVDRGRHGWSGRGIDEMLMYTANTFYELIRKGFIRVVEEDPSLRRRYLSVQVRSSRRVCWQGYIMDLVINVAPLEDYEVLTSLLLAYDLLAIVPKTTEAGGNKRFISLRN